LAGVQAVHADRGTRDRPWTLRNGPPPALSSLGVLTRPTMQTMESPIQQYLDELLTDVAQLREGTPYLVHPPGREPDPDAFGICLATVDGHVYTSGDADHEFSIHSISKPFSYALALEDDQDF